MSEEARVQALFLILPLLAVAACSPETDAPKSTAACAASLYGDYDPRNFDQCVAACIKCEHGITTTCSTSCRLKGAR